MQKKLTFSIKPITSRIAYKAFPSPIIAAAIEEIELSPAVDSFSRSAICIEGEFSKAISAIPSSTLEEMAKMVPEGLHRHNATKAYLLPNSLIADGSTYCKNLYSSESAVRRRPIILGRYNCYDELQLSSSLGNELFFGHWLIDGACQELIAEDRGMESIVHKTPPVFHKEGYRSIFDLHPISENVCRVKKLWIIDDLGNNDYKVSRFARIYDRIKKFSRPSNRQQEYIFLARRGGASRTLTNESEIFETLEKHGFHFLDCTDLEPKEIIEVLSSARIVISVDGSHQSHAVLAMPARGAIISIQPPDRVNLKAYREFCDYKNIRQAFIIGDLRENGFSIDPDRLLKLLDLTVDTIS